MVNDILWVFIEQMINLDTLHEDVLHSFQIIVDWFSIAFALSWLWWFLMLPKKILQMTKGGIL